MRSLIKGASHMSKRYGTDFTEGSIPKKMLLFALPLMGANLLQVVYSMVDMMIVGNFVGSAAISAVGTASQVVVLFTMLGAGYCAGAQVYISQLLGARRRDKLNETIGTVFTVVIAMGLVSCAVCFVFCRQILGLLNVPDEAMPHAVSYLHITGGLIVFTFGYNLVSSLQRAQGDSRHPLYFIILATLINVLLDLLFTGFLGWGTRGAAWATVIGQAVSFAAALAFLYGRREQFGFDFQPGSFRVNRKAFVEITKLGGVNIIQYCLVYLSMLCVIAMVNSQGVAASATLSVGLKIDDIISKATLGFSIACIAMVGQNFAAGKSGRVRKTVTFAWVYSFVCYGIFAVAYLAFSRQIFGAFTSDEAVLEVAPLWIRASVCGYAGVALLRGTFGLTQGVGNVRLSFVLSLVDSLIVRIGLAFILGSVLGMGTQGYYLGYLNATYAAGIPGLIYFLSGRWEKRRLVVGD